MKTILTFSAIALMLVSCGKPPAFEFLSIGDICEFADSVCEPVIIPPDTVTVVKKEFVPQCIPFGEFPPIYFSTNSYELGESELGKLRIIRDRMMLCDCVQVIIEGYADERLSESYNYELGLQRANAVQDWLYENGIALNRMEVVSYGESMPVIETYGIKPVIRFIAGDTLTIPTGGNLLQNAWQLNRRVIVRMK